MSRLAPRFEALRAEQRTALIPYIVAGDPHPDATVALMHNLVAAGANAIELGVPFSDPQADGPVIQDACQRALHHSVRLADVLAMVAAFRRTDTATPVVLMGYLNPIECMGAQLFADRATEAGIDGVLVVDQPPEEGGSLQQALSAQAIDSIFLVSPTTADERLARVSASASGFIYYVSLKGVTGAGTLAVDDVKARVAEVRSRTQLPVGVGFGIRTPEAGRQIGAFADAVVIGSAIIEQIATHADDHDAMQTAVTNCVTQMRSALDTAAADGATA